MQGWRQVLGTQLEHHLPGLSIETHWQDSEAHKSSRLWSSFRRLVFQLPRKFSIAPLKPSQSHASSAGQLPFSHGNGSISKRVASTNTRQNMSSATVHIVFGPQGAGKTTYSRKLAVETGSVRFSIDEWMNQMFGPDLPKPMSLPWLMERVRRCEDRIWSTAAEVVERGTSVVLDLGFMKVGDRSRFVALSEARGLRIQRHFVTAPHDLRRERVMSRNAIKGETFAFEVTPAMFDFMERLFEAPTEAELASSMRAT